jgi:hypothetical protein
VPVIARAAVPRRWHRWGRRSFELALLQVFSWVLPSTFSDAGGWFATTNTAFKGENVE